MPSERWSRALAGVLIACAADWSTSAHAQSPPSKGIAATTRQVTDAAGRVVRLPDQVRRVADPWHANNATVLMLGGADKLVATTVQARQQPWLRELYPRINEVPAAFNVAGELNVETLMSTRPDVILMAYDGTPPKWMGTVSAFNIPVVLMPNKSLADLQTTALLTGEVLGKAEAKIAAEYVEYFRGNIQKVTDAVRNLPNSAKPRVLHTASAGILTVDGQDTVVDDWIRIAGGVNVANVTGNGRPVSLEQVLAWNPDVIIVGSAPNLQNRRAILDDPRWQRVKAVREGKVFSNPTGAYLWDRHSAEAALQVLWAAKHLHPSLFHDVDMDAETRRFYSRFFHKVLSDRDLASIMSATEPRK